MGDIDIKHLNEAKVAAINFIRNQTVIESESEFILLVVVFVQLLNCILFRVVGNVARLTYKDIQHLCRDNRIHRLFSFRNVTSHLYGTHVYYKAFNDLQDLFPGDFYNELLVFTKEVIVSVEDGTFIEKYGVPTSEEKVMSDFNKLLNDLE